MTRCLVIANQKGGVGKTTTTANLGAALAHAGRKTLVVDLDPQGNLTSHLGVQLEPGQPSVYSAVMGQTPLRDVIRPTAHENLSLVPASLDLAGAEVELVSVVGRETVLRDALKTLKGMRYDFILIDCPPSLGLLTINALCAATELLIPVQTEFFALQGLSQLLSTVNLVRKRLNPRLALRGILPCLVDGRRNLSKEVLARLSESFEGQVFRTAIRNAVALAEASGHGKTVFDYAPRSHGAVDYAAFAREVIEHV
jgi:chromosome partitioning protein